MSYNTTRETFPNNLLSGMFNFQEAQLFEIDRTQEGQAPKISF
jgi:LemA protein